MKLAVLDDYQAAAKDLADWTQLPAGTDVQFFHDHIANEDQLVERLKDFDMVMGMRERTPFTRSVMSRLPKLRLLITTGRRARTWLILTWTPKKPYLFVWVAMNCRTLSLQSVQQK